MQFRQTSMSSGNEPCVVVFQNVDGAIGDHSLAGVLRPFLSWARPLVFVRQEVERGRDPGPLVYDRRVAALIIGGSPASVLDRLPWMERQMELAVEALEDSIPLLGICFGHQLLAMALGGQVASWEESRLGLAQIDLTEDPLFFGLGPRATVAITHREWVSRMPSGFRLIASSSYCPVQAMRHESRTVYGVQFHPDAGPWVREHASPRWRSIPADDLAATAGPAILENFARIVKKEAGIRD